MERLEDELDRARELEVAALADAIEEIGFECTRCGGCCKGLGEEHTATVFPEEVRELADAEELEWRDVARPMPFGLDADGTGETFEWALQTDDCGDCAFYEEDDASAASGGDAADGERGTGACTVHEHRPLICRTYPFSVALGGTSQPMGEAVDEAGMVRAHECEGLGRDISRADAEELAAALKERAVTELEEAIAVRDEYDPINAGPDETVVHDSEGAKRPDGTRYEAE
ncbi:Fe-S-cluster containining protein [Halarchaeum rubridurum]|uniref:Fe-S-cluster containining protein n=1 Tax=Halarchaeum rubridurum TaxID=489911 RepID=A0A830FZS7_9EURY|nr:YkgJ family cysteine cluster protein [Halarchaeum rubridurum]MBP1955189.1 Fe-S-cluster containining protein [Halarchaeum rubridurum]GGM68259.1 zinc/iron-chelating domain-containing protein [Halarchaeum rubridurum]